jgi:hypothetical protein
LPLFHARTGGLQRCIAQIDARGIADLRYGPGVRRKITETRGTDQPPAGPRCKRDLGKVRRQRNNARCGRGNADHNAAVVAQGSGETRLHGGH